MKDVRPQLLIDGDIIAYTIAASNQIDVMYSDEEVHRSCNLGDMKKAWDEEIKRLTTLLKGDVKIIAFSDASKNNFRKKFLPSYKDNRKSTEKPIGLAMLTQWIKEAYPDQYKFVPHLEADDILGIYATNPNADTSNMVIVSVDKDFMTIPNVTLYNQGKHLFHESDTSTAYDFFLTQVLSGDTVDGYSGCPGIGPAKAEKYVAKGWTGVVEAYEKAGLTEEDALVQARCARILHHSDYNFKTKEVIPWHPIDTKECFTKKNK
jgi:DNA polymerase I